MEMTASLSPEDALQVAARKSLVTDFFLEVSQIPLSLDLKDIHK